MAALLPVKPHQPVLNGHHPIAHGLINYWGFTEGGGDTIFDSVEGLPAVASGSPVWVDGETGYEADIGNVGSRQFAAVVDSNHPLAGATDWSCMCVARAVQKLNGAAWAWGDTTAGAGLHVFYPNDNWGGTGNDGERGSFDGGNQIFITDGLFDDADLHVMVITAATEGANTRHILYTDGQFRVTGIRAGAALDATPSNIWLGGWNGGQVLNGQLSCVAFWDRPLDANEAEQLALDPFSLIRPTVGDGGKEFFFFAPPAADVGETYLAAYKIKRTLNPILVR